MLNFCDFIQVFVFTINHHLNIIEQSNAKKVCYKSDTEDTKFFCALTQLVQTDKLSSTILFWLTESVLLP